MEGESIREKLMRRDYDKARDSIGFGAAGASRKVFK